MDGSTQLNLEKFNEVVAYDSNTPRTTRIEMLGITPGQPNTIYTLTLEDFEDGRVRLVCVDDETEEGYVVRSSGAQLFCAAANHHYIRDWLLRHNGLLAT